MEVINLQEEFLGLLAKASSDAQRCGFLKWLKNVLPEISDGLSPNGVHANVRELADARCKIVTISNDIRDRLPLGAIMHTEQIIYPTVGEDSDMNEQNCLHLDAFLYDEDDEEALVREGKLTRAFCKDCGSRNTETLRFITHSCSKERLEYIFTSLLPPGLEGKTVLDIGSRLGAVLYGAYFFSKASKIVGIEVNAELCQLQQQVVRKYNMEDRIQVLHAEMTTVPNVVSSADVIILNNVFDWFMRPELQVKMWQSIRETVKPGALLVTIPSLPESLQNIQTGVILDSWVRELKPTSPDTCQSEEVEINEVKLYQVISNNKTNNGFA